MIRRFIIVAAALVVGASAGAQERGAARRYTLDVRLAPGAPIEGVITTSGKRARLEFTRPPVGWAPGNALLVGGAGDSVTVLNPTLRQWTRLTPTEFSAALSQGVEAMRALGGGGVVLVGQPRTQAVATDRRPTVAGISGREVRLDHRYSTRGPGGEIRRHHVEALVVTATEGDEALARVLDLSFDLLRPLIASGPAGGALVAELERAGATRPLRISLRQTIVGAGGESQVSEGRLQLGRGGAGGVDAAELVPPSDWRRSGPPTRP